MKLFAENHHAV